MSTYRFKLIKAVKAGPVQIKWAEENPDGSWDDHILTSEDPARPELYEALGAFAEAMAGTHRLQRDDEHEIEISALQYERDKSGHLDGVILHASVQLSKHTWWAVKSVSLGVSGEEKEAELNEVEREAGLYINGLRAQLKLALEQERPPTSTEEQRASEAAWGVVPDVDEDDGATEAEPEGEETEEAELEVAP